MANASAEETSKDRNAMNVKLVIMTSQGAKRAAVIQRVSELLPGEKNGCGSVNDVRVH